MTIERQSPAGTRQSRYPWWLAVGTGFLGVSISVFAWVRLHDMEEQRLAQEFHAEAEGVRNAAQREVSLFMEVLESIGALHSLSSTISPSDFAEFVDKGMMHQKRILGAFGFAQRIPNEGRQLLEKDPASPLSIIEAAEDGTFRPAADRPGYSPLMYQTPENGLQVPLGFDFGSTAEAKATLDAMYASGRVALGAHVRSSAFANGYYVFAPIISPFVDDATGTPGFMAVGFAVAILNPNDMLARVSTLAPSRDMDIRFLQEPSPVSLPASLTVRAPLAVADQTWTIECTARREFAETKRPGRANIVLAAGLLFTALLTGELLLMARRNRATEETVLRRTADLREAKEKLEKEMHERLRLENEIIEISSREKERVGRDLHDSLGQKLTGAAMLSRSLVDQLPDADRDNARKVNEIIKDSITQVRRIARGLSPVELGEEGLIDALRLLSEETEQTCGIACAFRTAGEPKVRTGPVATHLYHIAQEAISNAVRHGKAKRITTTLDAQGTLTIEDDGSGVPADASRHGGMGLKLMRYRAAMIGGQLDIQPRPEGGTKLVCRFSTTNGHE